LHAGQRRSIAVDQIRVLGNVIDDAQTLFRKRLEPFGFDRTGELNQAQTFALEVPRSSLELPHFRRPRVKPARVEFDDVEFISGSGAGVSSGNGWFLVRFDELKALIIRNQPAAPRNQRVRLARIAHTHFVRCCQSHHCGRPLHEP
jgi:hypothetical protein